MKREELMINDIVFDYTNSPVKVCAVGQDIVVKNSFGIGSLEPNELSPIPLTEEILVKFGFFVTTDQYNQEVWKMKGHELVVVESGFYIHLFGAMCRIDYLHQLQQLIRIMGIEKEIEL